jgi:hypothetical protein
LPTLVGCQARFHDSDRIPPCEGSILKPQRFDLRRI